MTYDTDETMAKTSRATTLGAGKPDRPMSRMDDLRQQVLEAADRTHGAMARLRDHNDRLFGVQPEAVSKNPLATADAPGDSQLQHLLDSLSHLCACIDRLDEQVYRAIQLA
jgi:hypothetical protein